MIGHLQHWAWFNYPRSQVNRRRTASQTNRTFPSAWSYSERYIISNLSCRMCLILKYLSKSIRKNFCKSIIDELWYLAEPAHAPTHLPSTGTSWPCISQKWSKLVILLSICPKGLTGLGRFDSINSYLLASSYGFGYMSYFSEPLFTVLHCKTCTET